MCQGMSVRSHCRSQRITDLLLIPVSIASIITGFELHVAGENAPHEVWEQWAAAHVVATVLFLVLGILHVRHHWAWYKSLFSKGLGKKSRVTLLLTFTFLFLVVTGVILIVAIDGPNSTTGHLHYMVIQELVWVNNISLGKVPLISRIGATYLRDKCHLSLGKCHLSMMCGTPLPTQIPVEPIIYSDNS